MTSFLFKRLTPVLLEELNDGNNWRRGPVRKVRRCEECRQDIKTGVDAYSPTREKGGTCSFMKVCLACVSLHCEECGIRFDPDPEPFMESDRKLCIVCRKRISPPRLYELPGDLERSSDWRQVCGRIFAVMSVGSSEETVQRRAEKACDATDVLFAEMARRCP